MKMLILILFLYAPMSFSSCLEEKGLDRFIETEGCQEVLTADEARACLSSSHNFGGLFNIICSKGPQRGCCYSKMSGSTQSRFRLNPNCEDIDYN